MATHWRRIAVGVVGLAGVDVLQLIVPQLVRHAVDALASGAATLGRVAWCGAGMCAAAVGMGLCRFVWRYFLIGASHLIERDLRERLYRHWLKLPATYFDEHKVGDLIAHATNDAYAVRRAVGFAALAAIDAAFLALTVVGIMVWMNARLTLVVLVPLPAIAWVMLHFGRRMHERFERVQQVFGVLTERAQEAFSGIRVVKAYGAEGTEARLFREEAQRYADEAMKLARVLAWYDPLIGALATSSFALLLWWGGRSVLAGELTLGGFVAFMSYVGMLVWPMIAVGVVVNMMERGAASLGRIRRILETHVSAGGGGYSGAVAARVTCRGLTFTYPRADEPALVDIACEFAEGSTVGIVGRTGAGKTTLLEVVMRVYEPPPGTVYLGGVDIRDVPLATVRRMFMYVPQEPFLFSMSVADNIRFGRPELSLEEVDALARCVGLDEEIKALPQGYDTVVGERGITLSGGQKQRVAIARALAMQAPILVLDDALSSVDAETEAKILDHLRTLAGSVTILMVAHRVSALREADVILVMDRGRIVDRGTHAELVSREGYYRELYELQRIEAIELARLR